MANLKSITELPVAESANGLNLIVNDNGAAKQIAASAVGAQADFAVIDENNPAFIKNKPAVAQADWNQNDKNAPSYIKNRPFWEEIVPQYFELPVENFQFNSYPINNYSCIYSYSNDAIPPDGTNIKVILEGEEFLVPCKTVNGSFTCGDSLNEFFTGGGAYGWTLDYAKESGELSFLSIVNVTRPVIISFDGKAINSISLDYLPQKIEVSRFLDGAYEYFYPQDIVLPTIDSTALGSNGSSFYSGTVFYDEESKSLRLKNQVGCYKLMYGLTKISLPNEAIGNTTTFNIDQSWLIEDLNALFADEIEYATLNIYFTNGDTYRFPIRYIGQFNYTTYYGGTFIDRNSNLYSIMIRSINNIYSATIKRIV